MLSLNGSANGSEIIFNLVQKDIKFQQKGSKGSALGDACNVGGMTSCTALPKTLILLKRLFSTNSSKIGTMHTLAIGVLNWSTYFTLSCIQFGASYKAATRVDLNRRILRCFRIVDLLDCSM